MVGYVNGIRKGQAHAGIFLRFLRMIHALKLFSDDRSIERVGFRSISWNWFWFWRDRAFIFAVRFYWFRGDGIYYPLKAHAIPTESFDLDEFGLLPDSWGLSLGGTDLVHLMNFIIEKMFNTFIELSLFFLQLLPFRTHWQILFLRLRFFHWGVDGLAVLMARRFICHNSIILSWKRHMALVCLRAV